MLGALPHAGIAATDIATLTVGTAPTCGGGADFGYDSATGLGSYSPTGLTGGKTVRTVVEEWTTCIMLPVVTIFKVSGFSSNPGAGWLTSVRCNGVTKVPSGAPSYSAGTAGWVWAGNPFLLINKQGQNVSCTVVHN